MTDYSVGKKFYYNPDDEDSVKYYGEASAYCNENNLEIAEVGTVEQEVETKRLTADGEETVKEIKTLKQFEIKSKSEEDKAEMARRTRGVYLTAYVDPIVCNPLRWAELSEDEQQQYKDYRQYLLNIPQQANFPNEKVKMFAEWKDSGE